MQDQHKGNEQKLSIESAYFFKIMHENAQSTSIILLDKNGTILDINAGLQKSFGYTREDLIGKNFSLLFIDEDRTKKLPEKELDKAIKTGSATDNNYILHKNGSHIWVHGESIYSMDDKGKEFLIKIIQDINDKMVLEEKLKRKNNELKMILKDRDTFVYAASHDLQSPINNIEGLVKYLEKGAERGSLDSKKTKTFFEMIYTSIDKFRSTIRDLAFIGKEEEEGKVNTEDIEFKYMLQEVTNDLKQEIQHSGTEILSDFSHAPVVQFSPKNLRSILFNLISNAIKYRDPDRKPRVTLTSEKLNAECVLLKVQDNGLGIKEAEKDEVFQMYKRLHEHTEGSGVGMGIAKRIIENAGGKIELESKVGEGSIFKIYFGYS